MMDSASPVAGPSRLTETKAPHDEPVVSTNVDVESALQATHSHWVLRVSLASEDESGVVVEAFTESDDAAQSSPASSSRLRHRFPSRVPRSPRLEAQVRHTSGTPKRARVDAATRPSDKPVLLRNALKLESLAVSRVIPSVQSAPVVTICNRCRPNSRVIFDQHYFARSRGAAPPSSNGSNDLSTPRPIIDTSLMAHIPILTPSNGGSVTLSSPASSVTGLPATGTPASSLVADSSEYATPSSPPARRSNAWGKPRSWADLVTHMAGASVHNVPGISENVGESSSTPNRSPTQSITGSPVVRGRGNGPEGTGRRSRADKASRQNGSTLPTPKSLETLFHEAETQFSASLTYPRGIINTGNMCFANAILQALLFCAPFYNLFRVVSQHVPHDFHNSTPLIEAVIQFLDEFRLIPESVQNDMQDSPAIAAESLRALHATSEPFIPDQLYDAMKLHKRFDTMRRGHQEDAEEFLGFFLDTLHEELQSAISKAEARMQKKLGDVSRSSSLAPESVKAAQEEEDESIIEEREVKRPASPSEGDGWLEVGQKGKTSFTRTTSTSHSPITRIFGGKLRSVLRAPGSKDSVTLEPYQPLQLDIQPPHVTTVEQAIENLTVPEMISGVMSSNKHLVDATKQVFIETLPSVLVLHLKRFVYDDVGGVQKSSKVLGYGPTLEISESAISPARRGEVQRRYKLFAVVYHHGRYATGGHYTVDVLRQDRSEWLHIDDTTWASAPPPSSSSAASANGPALAHGGSAYLLFYAREDALVNGGALTANGEAFAAPIATTRDLPKSKLAHQSASTAPIPARPHIVPGAVPGSPVRTARRGPAQVPGAGVPASPGGINGTSASQRAARSRTSSVQQTANLPKPPSTTVPGAAPPSAQRTK